MKCTNATKVNRKSGVGQWRDLQFSGPLLVTEKRGRYLFSCILQVSGRS